MFLLVWVTKQKPQTKLNRELVARGPSMKCLKLIQKFLVTRYKSIKTPTMLCNAGKTINR